MIGTYNNNYVNTPIVEVHASTMNIDASAGIIHTWSATGNETINFINGQAGMKLSIYITCDITPRTVTLGTGVSASIATFLLTSLKQSVMTLEHNGTNFILAPAPTTLL